MKGESVAVVKVRPVLAFDPPPSHAWCDRCNITGHDATHVASVLIVGVRVLQVIVCDDCAAKLGARS